MQKFRPAVAFHAACRRFEPGRPLHFPHFAQAASPGVHHTASHPGQRESPQPCSPNGTAGAFGALICWFESSHGCHFSGFGRCGPRLARIVHRSSGGPVRVRFVSSETGICAGGGMVDAPDLESGGFPMRVQIPPGALFLRKTKRRHYEAWVYQVLAEGALPSFRRPEAISGGYRTH